MTKTFSTLLILVLSVVEAAAQPTAGGRVFIDANGNGRYDRGETLLADIPVSDGCRVVTTDAKGRYRIEVGEGSSLFPILPAGYTMQGHRLVNSAFVYPAVAGSRHDFALSAKPVSHRFRLNAIGDIQVGNSQELEFASRTILPELMTKDSTDVNIFLGDLVNNNLALYPHLQRMIAQLPSRSYTVVGNHDRDVDSLLWRQTATYSATFGSPVYAFNEGDVHFIVLNNVYGRGARGYEGRVSQRQLQFVREDLAHVSPSRLVVLVMHIPLAVTRNRDELFAAVGARPMLALTAHLHRVMRDFHRYDGRTIPELGVGATCGFWWVGERDWEGVPMALQQGGTPRNYFVLDFDGPRYTFRCKGVGLDDHRQMTVHVVGIDSLDHRLRDLRDVAPRQALITVWGGCDSTRVRCRVDGGAWTLCQRADVLDPNAARVREQNLSKGYPTPYSRRNPIRHLSSPQIWSLPLSEAQCKGAHVIEVQADDSYGLRAHTLRPYCYVEPAR